MPNHKRYPVDQCLLFKTKSPDQLAERLRIPRGLLDKLLGEKNNYLKYLRDGRLIQEPKPRLKQIHIRITKLLSRMETPTYLHSGIKGRSYISNAAVHNPNERTIKLDVKKFYPSARAAAVFHFFVDVLQCDRDVAGMLTRLLTVDGYLPTGGNASSILSFWAYKPMFDELDSLAKYHGCEFSLYVDDASITGAGATRALIQAARKIVSKYRLKAHKTHAFDSGQPKVVTGVAVTKRGLKVPNRRQKAIAEGLASLEASSSDAERIRILNPLISRVYEAGQVDPDWLPRAKELVATRRGITRRF
jgi:RNA-directed DNA polymerase